MAFFFILAGSAFVAAAILAILFSHWWAILFFGGLALIAPLPGTGRTHWQDVKRNGQVLATPEVTTYTYTATGNRASATLPNGVQTLYSYDSMNRLVEMRHVSTNGTVLMSFAYRSNLTNQRTNVTEIITAPNGSVHTEHNRL